MAPYTHSITVVRSEVGLSTQIGLPQFKVDEINNGNEKAAASLARALLAPYTKHPVREDVYYKELHGHKFLLDLTEKDSAMIDIIKDFQLHGDYEPYTTEIAEREVKEGMTAVDVGASHGYFTLLLAKLVGKTGKVYSFEPTSNQFPYLLDNIKVNGYEDRVIATNAGAYSNNDHGELRINEGNTVPFKLVVLDDVLPEKVDFIKIDVDGAEPHVLKGLEKTVQNNPQLKMVIEYYPEYITKLGNNPQDVLDFLDKYFNYERIKGDFENEAYYNLYCVRK